MPPSIALLLSDLLSVPVVSCCVRAGKGGERGVARPEVLQELLGSCERVVQEIDSVEYGLTDIQEYYANTGALVAAAKNARKGKDVGCR